MPVPLHILTGFLGAGKSTVLARLLAEGTGERVVVLVNEVGELSIDHHLLQTVDGDGALLLTSGCVCCTIHGELFAALERALALLPDRIVLETTGLADPAPIAAGLAKHPRLKHQVRLAGIVAVVDAVRGAFVLDAPEARAQVALADRVVISKVDLAPSRVPQLRARLDALAPAAAVLEAADGQVPPGWLLGGHPLPDATDLRALTAAPHDHHGHEAHTQVLALPSRVDLDALQLWLSIIAQLDGALLLRAKGIVRSRGDGALHVLQSVEHEVLPARRLDAVGSDWPGSRMVLISRGASEAQRARWASFAAEAAEGLTRRASPSVSEALSRGEAR